jgi:hypothetical protein
MLHSPTRSVRRLLQYVFLVTEARPARVPPSVPPNIESIERIGPPIRIRRPEGRCTALTSLDDDTRLRVPIQRHNGLKCRYSRNNSVNTDRDRSCRASIYWQTPAMHLSFCS